MNKKTQLNRLKFSGSGRKSVLKGRGYSRKSVLKGGTQTTKTDFKKLGLSTTGNSDIKYGRRWYKELRGHITHPAGLKANLFYYNKVLKARIYEKIYKIYIEGTQETSKEGLKLGAGAWGRRISNVSRKTIMDRYFKPQLNDLIGEQTTNKTDYEDVTNFNQKFNATQPFRGVYESDKITKLHTMKSAMPDLRKFVESGNTPCDSKSFKKLNDKRTPIGGLTKKILLRTQRSKDYGSLSPLSKEEKEREEKEREEKDLKGKNDLKSFKKKKCEINPYCCDEPNIEYGSDVYNYFPDGLLEPKKPKKNWNIPFSKTETTGLYLIMENCKEKFPLWQAVFYCVIAIIIKTGLEEDIREYQREITKSLFDDSEYSRDNNFLKVEVKDTEEQTDNKSMKGGANDNEWGISSPQPGSWGIQEDGYPSDVKKYLKITENYKKWNKAYIIPYNTKFVNFEPGVIVSNNDTEPDIYKSRKQNIETKNSDFVNTELWEPMNKPYDLNKFITTKTFDFTDASATNASATNASATKAAEAATKAAEAATKAAVKRIEEKKLKDKDSNWGYLIDYLGFDIYMKDKIYFVGRVKSGQIPDSVTGFRFNTHDIIYSIKDNKGANLPLEEFFNDVNDKIYAAATAADAKADAAIKELTSFFNKVLSINFIPVNENTMKADAARVLNADNQDMYSHAKDIGTEQPITWERKYRYKLNMLNKHNINIVTGTWVNDNEKVLDYTPFYQRMESTNYVGLIPTVEHIALFFMKNKEFMYSFLSDFKLFKLMYKYPGAHDAGFTYTEKEWTDPSKTRGADNNEYNGANIKKTVVQLWIEYLLSQEKDINTFITGRDEDNFHKKLVPEGTVIIKGPLPISRKEIGDSKIISYIFTITDDQQKNIKDSLKETWDDVQLVPEIFYKKKSTNAKKLKIKPLTRNKLDDLKAHTKAIKEKQEKERNKELREELIEAKKKRDEALANALKRAKDIYK
jgi:hypothetical protein